MQRENDKNDNKSLELQGLPASFFRQNRTNYIKNLKRMILNLESDSILVLEGGEEFPRYDTDSNFFHFQQEASFYYLTGVTEAYFYAIIDLKTEETTLFHAFPEAKMRPFLNWPTLEEISKKYEINCLEMKDLYTQIKKRDPKKIYVLYGANSDSKLKILSAFLTFPEDMKEFNTRIDRNRYIYEILADTRTRKTSEEYTVMKTVAKISVAGHIEAMKKLKNLKIERDVEAAFFNYVRLNYDVRIHAYENICGCGSNSATLHYIDNNKELKSGNLILMDMGIRSVGYCSDITSTVPVNGKFTEKQKEIYDIVLKANQSVQKLLKPGVWWPDMHIQAERVILEGLKSLKLLNDYPIDELLKQRVGYYFMPHGLGHFMGLEVHDVGGYLSFTPPRSNLPGLSSLRLARYLQEGNVVTVEPGIYFIPLLLEKAFKNETISKYFNQEKINEYLDFGGIRIEDDIYITSTGSENFTKDLPRTTEEIENLMSS